MNKDLRFSVKFRSDDIDGGRWQRGRKRWLFFERHGNATRGYGTLQSESGIAKNKVIRFSWKWKEDWKNCIVFKGRHVEGKMWVESNQTGRIFRRMGDWTVTRKGEEEEVVTKGDDLIAKDNDLGFIVR
mmetsp:Transcript_20251/g.49196  ORF Transcript_20251/g.49196 Transcript_20251/m.49196 type:complete len:129 (-) Transcript_20251:630-1016(-)